ncbi:MAG: hypothetical protein EAZ69_12830 [Oscillatoriales cyanobacterium]|nr:MAG: hypothetical protein EAZ69_12830 [Oscillatoriales cyanobacterium]
MSCRKLDIWPIAFLEWDNPIKLDVVDVGWPDPSVARGTYIAGPKSYPMRPYIKQTFANSAGLASIVSRGNQETLPMAVLIGKTTRIIKLLEPPSKLSARSDGGVWTNYPLSHYDSTGALKRVVEKVPGVEIVGVEQDAVWVMDLDLQAWFVNAEGEVRGPYPWGGFAASVASKQAICHLNRDAIRRVECLEPDGKKRYPLLSLPRELRGGLLSFSNDRLLTGDITGGSLNYYNTGGLAAKLTIENAGITPTGDAFVSVIVDDKSADVCVSNGTTQRVFIEYDDPSRFPIPLKLGVAAVEGDRTLVYGFDRAVWYKGDRVEKTFVVDDNVYRKDIFPHHWRTSTNFVTANSSDGTIILSTSGPTGMAIIGMRWNPESK